MNPTVKSAKIALILPFYNPGAIFSRTLTSILNAREIGNTEIILINDGSTDQSLSIAESFAIKAREEGAEVSIISMRHNSGPADARRQGVLAASAPYMLNIDADDIVKPDLIATLSKYIDTTPADIFAFGYDFIKSDRPALIPSIDSPSDLIASALEATADTYLFNKLIRRSLYSESGAFCPSDIRLWDDKALLIPLLTAAKTIVIIPEILYSYRICNPGSITSSRSRYDDMQKAMAHIESFLTSANLIDAYRTALSRGKLKLKLNYLWATQGDAQLRYASLYNDIDPSVLDGTEIKGIWKLALTYIRMGSLTPFRIFCKLSHLIRKRKVED